ECMERALDEGSPETLHEWRKHAKYHWRHAQLLRPIWPGPIGAHAKEAKRLGERLGDHHDLDVLAQRLRRNPASYGAARDVSAFLELVGRRQRKLEAEAGAIGARLFVENGAKLRRRWEAYWDAWRAEEGPGKGKKESASRPRRNGEAR